MAMTRVTTAPLSTLLYDETEGRYLIRLSVWIDPEDMDLESDPDNDREPSISVSAQKGRTRIFGKIDKKAYKAYLTKDMPVPQRPVPMPTTAPVATHRERMYR